MGILLQKVKYIPQLPQATGPTSSTSRISDKAEVSRTLQGKKLARTLATVERALRGNCYNYFNLNLAMARAVNDTPLLGEKVPLDHFNDQSGLCCASQLKDATSRAAGPRRMGLRHQLAG